MINTMRHVFWAQLPAWARPTNAIFRYVRQQQSAYRGGLWSWLRWVGSLAILAGLVTLSYATVQNDTPFLLDSPSHGVIYDTLYFPLVVVQGVLMLIALLSMSSALATDQNRGTWEAITITSHGAEWIIRARWAALFYQMRWLLALLIGARIALAGLMLRELAAGRFDYLQLYTSGITPAIAPEVGGLLLAVWMTAALLQIVVLMGLNAAFGLLIAVIVRNRGVRTLVNLIAVLVEWGIWGWAMGSGLRLLDADPMELAAGSGSTVTHWIGLIGLGVLGDQGLRFMHLETVLQIWPDLDYGALLGVVWLAAIAAQVVITNGLLILVGRRAARPGRE